LIKKFKHIIFLTGVFLIPVFSFSQEDLASKEDLLVEQENINFQTFFFEALQQKAIENYDKAIYALEACNNIDKKSTAVLFELSKNYVFLLKYTEAEYYILKGLEIDPTNLFMLEHLRDIKAKQNDYKGAIIIQKRIIAQKPELESELVLLQIKSGNVNEAIELLKKLEDNNNLPSHLIPLKIALLQEVPSEETPVITANTNLPVSKLDNLKKDYYLKNDYQSLKLVLERELRIKDFLNLLKDSQEGLDLYPAQPFVYLMNGIALNSMRKYKDAVLILGTGFDFLVDDFKMEAEFMEQLGLSYKGMGQNKKASKYYNKAVDLRKK
jgi:tetratricopeptide (TPR) repeat protein